MGQIIKAQVYKALSLTMGQFINNLNQFVAAQGLKGGGNGTVDVGRIKDIPGVASQPLLQNQSPLFGQAAPPPTPQAPAFGPQQQGSVGVGGFAPTANVGQNISVGQPVTGLNVSNF